MNLEAAITAAIIAGSAAFAAQTQARGCYRPAPLPPGAYAPLPSYTRPAPARGLSQEQWKQQIVAEAQRFCTAFSNDPICHFKDRP
jgi:hypothetical protein